MSIGRREVLVGASSAALISAYPAAASANTRRRAGGREDALAMVLITQLINEWAHEVDANYGRNMAEADLLTADCRCKLEGQWISGLDAIAKFYQARFHDIKPGEPAPIVRQLLSNFRIMLTSESEARVGLNLLLFFKVGTVPFSDYCDPVEVADVRVDCRRGADGNWRISMLDSDRIFRRD